MKLGAGTAHGAGRQGTPEAGVGHAHRADAVSNPARGGRRNLARVAGWIAVAFGVVHVVVAPLEELHLWADIFGDRVWNTISLELTPDNLAYSHAFWVWPASFGVPVLLLGAFVLWTTRRGERIPASFGWAMIAWGAVLVVLLPASPAWALLLVGVLLVPAAQAPGTKDTKQQLAGVSRVGRQQSDARETGA